MPEFHVTWDLDVTADTPEEAAAFALEVQRNPDSTATVFTVCEDGGEPVTVDLDELDEEDK